MYRLREGRSIASHRPCSFFARMSFAVTDLCGKLSDWRIRLPCALLWSAIIAQDKARHEYLICPRLTTVWNIVMRDRVATRSYYTFEDRTFLGDTCRAKHNAQTLARFDMQGRSRRNFVKPIHSIAAHFPGLRPLSTMLFQRQIVYNFLLLLSVIMSCSTPLPAFSSIEDDRQEFYEDCKYVIKIQFGEDLDRCD